MIPDLPPPLATQKRAERLRRRRQALIEAMRRDVRIPHRIIRGSPAPKPAAAQPTARD